LGLGSRAPPGGGPRRGGRALAWSVGSRWGHCFLLILAGLPAAALRQ
jgi:hypothetical protein